MRRYVISPPLTSQARESLVPILYGPRCPGATEAADPEDADPEGEETPGANPEEASKTRMTGLEGRTGREERRKKYFSNLLIQCCGRYLKRKIETKERNAKKIFRTVGLSVCTLHAFGLSSFKVWTQDAHLYGTHTSLSPNVISVIGVRARPWNK